MSEWMNNAQTGLSSRTLIRFLQESGLYSLFLGSGPGSTGCSEPKLTGSRQRFIEEPRRGASHPRGKAGAGHRLEPWALHPGPGPSRGSSEEAWEVCRPCSHAQAWVFPPAPKIHPPHGSFGVFFLTFKEKSCWRSRLRVMAARQEYGLLKSTLRSVLLTR